MFFPVSTRGYTFNRKIKIWYHCYFKQLKIDRNIANMN